MNEMANSRQRLHETNKLNHCHDNSVSKTHNQKSDNVTAAKLIHTQLPSHQLVQLRLLRMM